MLAVERQRPLQRLAEALRVVLPIRQHARRQPVARRMLRVRSDLRHRGLGQFVPQDGLVDVRPAAAHGDAAWTITSS